MAGLLKDLGALFAGGVRLGIGASGGTALRYALLLAMATALVWLVVARTRLRMYWRQRAVLASLRTLTVALLVLALVQVVQTSYRRALAVVLLADVSQSVPDQAVARANGVLADAEKAKGDAIVRAIAFDGSPKPIDPPAGSPPVAARLDLPTETNIQKALHLAYDQFPEGYTARAVVLTDGNQTQGDLDAEAEVAADRGVAVSFIALPTLAVRDAAVESLNLPKRARAGEEITVAARILANHEAAGRVVLRRGEGVVARQALAVKPGENWVRFTTAAAGAGAVPYSVEIQTPEDADRGNDRLTSRVEVLARPRLLYVSGKPESDVAVVQALKDGGITVEPAPLAAFPTRIGELNYFDGVVLSDVDPKAFPAAQVGLLRDYVRDYGGGLVFLGGEASSVMGKKGEDLPLEDLLPVRFKEKKKTEPNPVAMFMVLDKSNSMGRENKFGMAIRAVKDAIAELPEKSVVGVVAFDDRPYATLDPTDVKEKDAIETRLDVLGVDGGTSIFPALELTYNKIRKLPNKVRHVILLSDGFSNTRYLQNVQLIEEYKKKKITISTVGLGRECDPAHLQTIADQGGGKFYHVMDIAAIPKIFLKETKRVTQTNIVEKAFTPKAVKTPDFLARVRFAGVPELTGYNTTDPKPSSETFLLADGEEPLLARWRYGLGRVTAFTSDAGLSWAKSWTAWSELAPLMLGVVRGTIRDLNFQLFKVSARTVGENVELAIDAADTHGNFLNNLALTVEVVNPDETSHAVETRQVRPGGYAGTFPLAGYGPYTIRVAPKIEGRRASEAVSRVLVAPPSEFIRLAPDQALMGRVAARTGGKVNPSLAEILAPAAENFPEKKPLWPYLVLLALGLHMVGLLLRRT